MDGPLFGQAEVVLESEHQAAQAVLSLIPHPLQVRIFICLLRLPEIPVAQGLVVMVVPPLLLILTNHLKVDP